MKQWRNADLGNKYAFAKNSENPTTYYFDHVHQPCPVHEHQIPFGSGQIILTADGCCYWRVAALSHDARCTY